MNDQPPQIPETDNSDLESQVKRLAGQQHLGQLFASGLLKHPDDSHSDIAAALLAHPDYSTEAKGQSSLRQAASEKLTKKLDKFLEGLGSLPPVSDEKGAEKLIGKTHIFLMKTPGFSKMKADDKNRIVHKILALASKGDTSDLHEIIDHEARHSKAKDAINGKVTTMLSNSFPKEAPVSSDERNQVKDYVDQDGLNDEMRQEPHFAEGGEVNQPHPGIHPRVASAYPEQAMIMGGAKARVHSYLNTMKPRQPSSMPFDSKLPDPKAHKQYSEAVDMAARPLSILDSVKDGSVSPDKFKHFANMHPELHELLRKKLTEDMTKSQVSGGKRPPFKTRQAMSMFMGAPLERSLNPASVMAAQATFMQEPAPQQPQSKPKAEGGKKGSSSSLSKGAASALTPLQASEKHQIEKS